ncbi:PIR protein [Plasmodium vivax]|uniref:VIR protein n=1 Tax=Plasmodium vivax TaxID=5855 RepID=A0A565A445_PLAVI|nr:PIR protein [Plasmodium vivax]
MTFFRNYLFFNDIETYIENTEKVEKDKTVDTKYNFCGEFLRDDTFRSIDNVVNICKQFVELYNKHSSLKFNRKGYPSYNRDCEYMNYWLNSKLNEKKNNNNPIPVNTFYTKLKAIHAKIDKNDLLKPKIHDINRNELKNLNLLYNLRNKYIKIYNWAISVIRETNEICSKNSEDFVKDYMVAVNYCFSYETAFCKLLCKLREEYNSLFNAHDMGTSCNAKETKLPTYYELYPSANISSIKIDNNRMSFPLLGPIIGLVFILTFFYRFTAIGPWVRNKVRSIFSRDSNKNANRNELFLQNFDKQNINSSPGIYNITYNSARNN